MEYIAMHGHGCGLTREAYTDCLLYYREARTKASKDIYIPFCPHRHWNFYSVCARGFVIPEGAGKADQGWHWGTTFAAVPAPGNRGGGEAGPAPPTDIVYI